MVVSDMRGRSVPRTENRSVSGGELNVGRTRCSFARNTGHKTRIIAKTLCVHRFEVPQVLQIHLFGCEAMLELRTHNASIEFPNASYCIDRSGAGLVVFANRPRRG